MEIMRTPDDRFDGLPDCDFAPHYVHIHDLDGGVLRVHSLDEDDRYSPIGVLTDTDALISRPMINDLPGDN